MWTRCNVKHWESSDEQNRNSLFPHRIWNSSEDIKECIVDKNIILENPLIEEVQSDNHIEG